MTCPVPSNSQRVQKNLYVQFVQAHYGTIALISHTSKVMLKVLQARLQPSVNMNFQMFKLVLEKAEEPEIKLPTSAVCSKKQESSRKTLVLPY